MVPFQFWQITHTLLNLISHNIVIKLWTAKILKRLLVLHNCYLLCKAKSEWVYLKVVNNCLGLVIEEVGLPMLKFRVDPMKRWSSDLMEARSGQNYLINFLLRIFNFMSYVFNFMVERINFMACVFTFLISPINFMLHAFNYMVCGINFMPDIFNFVTHLINFMLCVFSFMACAESIWSHVQLILCAWIIYTLIFVFQTSEHKWCATLIFHLRYVCTYLFCPAN